MFKKFCTAFAFVIFAGIFNFCSANLRDYYDNNPDYVYVCTGHWIAYLYLPSVDVQEYNPPHYQIAGLFVTTDGIDRELKKIETIRYNWYTKETFVYVDDHWVNAESLFVTEYHLDNHKKSANALFRVAYGMNFYN